MYGGDESTWSELTEFYDWGSAGRPSRRRVYGQRRQAAVTRIYWRLRGILDREVKKIR